MGPGNQAHGHVTRGLCGSHAHNARCAGSSWWNHEEAAAPRAPPRVGVREPRAGAAAARVRSLPSEGSAPTPRPASPTGHRGAGARPGPHSALSNCPGPRRLRGTSRGHAGLRAPCPCRPPRQGRPQRRLAHPPGPPLVTALGGCARSAPSPACSRPRPRLPSPLLSSHTQGLPLGRRGQSGLGRRLRHCLASASRHALLLPHGKATGTAAGVSTAWRPVAVSQTARRVLPVGPLAIRLRRARGAPASHAAPGLGTSASSREGQAPWDEEPRAAVRPVSSLGQTARSHGVPPRPRAHRRDGNPSSGASGGAPSPPRSGCATAHAWGVYVCLCPFLLLGCCFLLIHKSRFCVKDIRLFLYHTSSSY